MRLMVAALVTLLALFVQPTGLYAQPYPARPIHIVVAFPPGGAADLMAHTVAAEVPSRPGQPVGVENRPAPPAGTPEPVVRQLNEAVSAGLRAPAARGRLDGQGMDVITDRPDGTAAVLRTEIAKWGKAIRDAGAEVD